MNTVAIQGAGELGATLSRMLAERELCRRVVLVDPDEGRAKGKALDLRQSGPVEGYDTWLDGVSVLEAAGECDAVVFADAPVFSGATPALPSTLDELARSASRVTTGPVVVASADAAAFVEMAVRSGLPRNRVLGSAGAAFAGVVRRGLAAELGARSVDVSVGVLGAPPGEGIVPFGTATCGGIPVERLSPVAARRVLDAARRRILGPVALAAAAARILAALEGSGGIAPVTVVLDGEYGHRGIALTVPGRLGHGRLERVIEVPLEPVDRAAFDRAAERRRRVQ